MMVSGKLLQWSNLKRIGSEAALILMLAFLLSSFSWALRSDRLAPVADPAVYEFELEFPLVTAEESLIFYEEGTHYFIDIRPGDFSGFEHIPGAFSIRTDTFEDDLLVVLDFIYPTDPLIVYGTGDLQRAAAMTARFRDRGYENLSILAGGYPAWRKAGGGAEGGSR
ncbi:MAG: hypothetical protein GY835_06300 [bacterium]|nr:hypothetical protein [bacterium]